MRDLFSEQGINFKFCVKLSVEIKHCAFNMIQKEHKNLRRKQQTSPRPKEARMLKSQMKKIMLITFFDISGIFHFEFILRGQTVSQAYYMEKFK
jgi:hypothetical protein